MKNEFVTVIGKKYYVDEDGKLDLSEIKIAYIAEIAGLDQLTNLQTLWLEANQIEEIKGLERLSNLQTLLIGANPIRETEKHLINVNAQVVVKYCQEKARKGR
jgi:Leucine-rich repeat (LRR) protein